MNRILTGVVFCIVGVVVLLFLAALQEPRDYDRYPLGSTVYEIVEGN